VDAGLAKPSYRGGAGLREYVSDWSDVWGDLSIEPSDLIDLGDRVVLLARQPSRAQASGVAITANFATVVTLEHGKVTRQQDFLDHSEALEAVGLRE
jgi:ketosteroid isomerase-like protein